MIAGSAAGFVLACLLLLGAVFFYRRRKKSQYEFLDALAAPTQRIHSRATLLAGEDMDDDAHAHRSTPSGAGGGGESIGMGSLPRGASLGRGSPALMREAGAASPYQDLSFPAPATPWDSGDGDPRSSMEALHHPSRAPPSAATQYMSQYLQRAGRTGSDTGSVFREQLGDGEGEGYREEEEERRVMGGIGGEGGHSRNVSGASEDPLIPNNPPPYSTTTPAGASTGALGAVPVRSSPLAASAVRGVGGGSGEGQARTRNWIERTLAR